MLEPPSLFGGCLTPIIVVIGGIVIAIIYAPVLIFNALMFLLYACLGIFGMFLGWLGFKGISKCVETYNHTNYIPDGKRGSKQLIKDIRISKNYVFRIKNNSYILKDEETKNALLALEAKEVIIETQEEYLNASEQSKAVVSLLRLRERFETLNHYSVAPSEAYSWDELYYIYREYSDKLDKYLNHKQILDLTKRFERIELMRDAHKILELKSNKIILDWEILIVLVNIAIYLEGASVNIEDLSEALDVGDSRSWALSEIDLVADYLENHYQTIIRAEKEKMLALLNKVKDVQKLT